MAVACVVAALLLGAGGAAAQGTPKVLGALDCEKCHKPAYKKWKQEEPAQYGDKAHANTQKQLSAPKAQAYAAAIGLADAADPKGRCVACHATVVRGSVRAGVSCESCHGPGSLWNPVHSKEPFDESYRKSLPLGLRDLHQKPAAIAALCVECHATPDKALLAAGHPSGADFDAGAGLKKLVHWTAAFTGDGSEHARHDFAQIGALARPLVQKALAGARGGPSPPRPASSPSSSGGIAATSGTEAKPGSARPGATQAPWDWDQPLPSLPDDYPSDDARAAEAEAERPVRAARRSVPSLVVERPELEPPEVEIPPDPAPALGAQAPGATAQAAALRGQAAELLAELLRSGGRAPGLPPARAPQEFKGPDSELLNLQEVALFLALEVLRQDPPAAQAPR